MIESFLTTVEASIIFDAAGVLPEIGWSLKPNDQKQKVKRVKIFEMKKKKYWCIFTVRINRSTALQVFCLFRLQLLRQQLLSTNKPGNCSNLLIWSNFTILQVFLFDKSFIEFFPRMTWVASCTNAWSSSTSFFRNIRVIRFIHSENPMPESLFRQSPRRFTTRIRPPKSRSTWPVSESAMDSCLPRTALSTDSICIT